MLRQLFLMPPHITVSIVSYNTRDLLRECLASLQAMRDELNLQILVADNASRDGSLEMVRNEFPDVEAFGTGANLGFGRAHNLCFERAQAPFFLVLNSDATISGQSLSAMRDFLIENPRAGAVGPQLFYPDGALQTSHGADPRLSEIFWEQTFLGAIKNRFFCPKLAEISAPHAVEQLAGACILFRSAAYGEMGGFDPQFWMYSEENDLNLRLRRAGWLLYSLPWARVQHHLGASSAQWRDRARMVAAYNWSRMFYFHRYQGARAAQTVKFWTIFGAFLRLSGWTFAALFRPSAREKVSLFRHVLRATWKMKI